MSIGKANAKAAAAAAAGASSLTQGVCMSIDWTTRLATVNINGGQVAIPMVGRAPYPGDEVWVGFLGLQPICLGTIPKATTGTVQGVPVGDQIAVAGDDGRTYTVPYLSVPADGARVILDWDSDGTIIGTPSAASTPVTPSVPGSAGGSSAGKATFNPVSSRNWWQAGSSWNKPEVWTSDSNNGLYFYGNEIPDTIPDNATEKVTRLYVDEYFNQYPSNLARIATHPHASQPSGAPSLTGAHPISAGSGWKDLTGSGIFELLKTGAARGVGTNGIGYHKFSRAGVKNSGALYMEWN